MSDLPTPDYTLMPNGRHFGVCPCCRVLLRGLTRRADKSGWDGLCPGRGQTAPHRVPLIEREPSEDFPPCRVCGAVPTGLRQQVGEGLLRSVTLVSCGHIVGVPWEVAVGLA